MNTMTKWHTEPATAPQKSMLGKIAAKKLSGEALAAKLAEIENCKKSEVDALKNEIFQMPWPKKVAPVTEVAAPAKNVETWDDIAEGNYAYEWKGKTHFYRVVRKAGKGKWEGRTFVNVQERASDELFPIYNYLTTVAILTTIRENGPVECQKIFAERLGRCAKCFKLLTDETNPYKSLGLGPDCGSK